MIHQKKWKIVKHYFQLPHFSEILKFEPSKFIEFIPDEIKIPNYVSVVRSNSILDQLSHRLDQGIYNGCGAGLGALKPLQVCPVSHEH